MGVRQGQDRELNGRERVPAETGVQESEPLKQEPASPPASVASRPAASETRVVRETDRARGGVSMWSVLSGTLVAFGAFVILSAIIGALLAATGIAEAGLRPHEAVNAGVGVGVAVVLAQFLSYLWGGYTAGRMARGSGAANGVLVPVIALILVGILGSVIAATTGAADDITRSDFQQLPLPLGRLADIGTAVGIGLLAAMFGGGALGGWLGARWHTKLENSA